MYGFLSEHLDSRKEGTGQALISPNFLVYGNNHVVVDVINEIVIVTWSCFNDKCQNQLFVPIIRQLIVFG